MIKTFNQVYQCDSITINLTNNCNLSCRYCFEKNKSKELDMMSEQTIIDTIDIAYSSHYVNPNFNNIFTINFFGGEPLLNWKAMKACIDHCNEKSYKVFYGVTTNLTILTDEMIDYIDKYRIHLLVSIDGIKQIHDKNRSNSYDTVIRNLNRLKDRDLLIYVEARMTVLPEDASSMFESVKHLYSLGIDNICPMPVTDVEWSDSYLNDYKDSFYKITQWFITITSDTSYKRNLSIKNINDNLINVMSPDVADDLLCAIYNNKWCAIDTNGDVYPCHQLPTSSPSIKQKHLIGNIYTGVDSDLIITNPRKASFYKEECNSCIARSVCKGGCPQENLRLNNKEDQPSIAYCSLHKIDADIITHFHKKILNSTTIRGKLLVRLKENLKIKDYLDFIFNETDLRDTLTASTRLIKLREMISSIGEEQILPTFKDYFQQRLVILASVIVTENKMNKE